MKLMTKELRARLPALYATEETPTVQKLIQACYFLPGSDWYWYPIEYDTKNTFFGLVAGFSVEFGYFQMSELQGIHGKWGVQIERDVYFKPTTVEQIVKRHRDRDGARMILGV